MHVMSFCARRKLTWQSFGLDMKLGEKQTIAPRKDIQKVTNSPFQMGSATIGVSEVCAAAPITSTASDVAESLLYRGC